MKLRLALLAAFALAWTLAGSAVAQVPAQAPEDDLRTRLETEVPRLRFAGDILGISVAVIRDGQVYWTGTSGRPDPSDPAQVKSETVFQAASLSKPVFSYIVLRLVDRGVIDLDKPLATYLPYPRLEHDERYRRITARMVLSHTSGLPNWGTGEDRIPFKFAPGESWGYSGEAYVYLQKTVEKLTGTPLPDLARREVFEPLGMSRSSYVWNPEFESGAAMGVDETGTIQRIDRRQEANAAASLLTTARDYARFLVAALAGRGLEPATRKAWLEPQAQVRSQYEDPASPKQPGIFWGLGWGLEQADGTDTFWHWGHQDAWRAYVVVRRDGKAGLVYFANSHEGLSIAKALSDLAVGGPRPGLAWLGYEQYDDPKRIARKETERKWLAEATLENPAKIAVPEEILKRLAGSYGPRTVTFENGSLYYQREGRPKYRLIPIGPGLFAAEGTGKIRVRIAEDGGKVTVLQPGGDEDETARTPSAPPPPP